MLGRRSPGAGATIRDRGSRLAVISSVYISLFLGFSFSLGVPSMNFSAYSQDIFDSGFLLLGMGEGLRLYSVRVLGTFFTFTVATRPDQKVIETGPYRFVRHPSYTGGLFALFGILLMLTNWLSLVAIAPALVAYAYRIRVEEKALLDGLGEDYRAYMKRTKRLIPYVL